MLLTKNETLSILGNLKGDIALFECVIVKIKFKKRVDIF